MVDYLRSLSMSIVLSWTNSPFLTDLLYFLSNDTFEPIFSDKECLILVLIFSIDDSLLNTTTGKDEVHKGATLTTFVTAALFGAD